MRCTPMGNLSEYLSITKDNENNLWIATYNVGVWKYDGRKVTPYRVQENHRKIYLFCLYTDHGGDLWPGTHEHGARKFNGETFVRFTR